MVGRPVPYWAQREALLLCLWREWVGGGVAERPRAHSQELWWQLKLLVPLATRFCQLGLAGALLTCFCPGVALKTSRKGDGAHASGKGTRLAPHGCVAGPVPGSHEIQYG